MKRTFQFPMSNPTHTTNNKSPWMTSSCQYTQYKCPQPIHTLTNYRHMSTDTTAIFNVVRVCKLWTANRSLKFGGIPFRFSDTINSFILIIVVSIIVPRAFVAVANNHLRKNDNNLRNDLLPLILRQTIGHK